MHKYHLNILLILGLFFNSILSNAQTFPNPASLSTGQGAQGTNDPIWQVSDWFYAIPQDPLVLAYVPAYISNNCAPGAWVDPAALPPPVNNGNWISGSDAPCTGNIGYRFFRLILNLPPDCGGNSVTTPGAYTLNLDGYVDNTLVDVMINGVSESLAVLPGGSFSAGSQVNLVLDGPWVPGINYVDFLVYNGGGPYGLLLVANSTANMSNDSDGDGMVDMNDLCPCEAGTNPYGCIDPINPGNCNSNQVRAAFAAAGCIELYSCINSCSMYFLNPASLSGTGAQAFAQTLGANLISIQDAAENQCIIDNLNSLGQSGVIWIGFNDELVEGSFEWYDQSPVIYTNWAAGEPNNSGDEDYVQIYVNGQWNDLAFGGSAKSIIEVNLCPVVDAGVNQVICDGTSATLTASNTLFGSSPYSYQWTNGAPTQSTSVTPASTTTYGVLSIDAYGCMAGDTVVVTVYDNPTVVVPINDSICDGASVSATNYTSPTAGATFDWINDNTNIGLAASGTGDIASFSATNTTTAPITANITVTPTANSCIGTPSTYTITVNPIPTVVVPINDTVCDNVSVSTTNFTSPTAGATFDWTNDNVNIGLTASGTGDISTFTATNTTTAPITANITVTPTANACVGTSSSYIITVNPTPTVVVPINDSICDGASVSATNYTSTTAGATFDWTNDNITIGIAASGTGDIASFSATNTTTAPITANITVTPTANSCIGTPSTYSITVNPIPTVVVPIDIIVCDDVSVSTTNFTSPTAGATFDWTNDNVNIGLTASGTGDISTFTATNTTTAPITANITVTPTANACVGTSSSYIITVNPTPTVVVPINDTVCDGASVSATNYTSPTTGTTFDWTNDNITIGIAASGTGDIASFSATNTTTAPITANITVTPTANSCIGTPSTYSITVNPTPTVIVPVDTIVCDAASINTTNFTSPTAGATFDWTNDNVNIGLTASGTGDISTFTATNTTTAPITANITVTPTANACVGTPSTYAITVHPLPTPNFTFPNVCFGTSTTFTDLSNANGGVLANWNWDFTNNNSVDNTNQNPTNGFTSFGIYTVELMVQTALGCKDSITKIVTVNPIPVANFSATSECLNTMTQFTDSSTIITGTISSFQWDFADGVGTSVVQSPSYLYGAANTYNVSLTVISDSGCIHTIVKPVVVFNNPTAAFTTTDVCQNLAANFDSSTSNGNGGFIDQWDWDIDFDGINHTTDYIIQNPTNNYATANTYTIELIVTTTDGCSDTTTNPITIFPMPIASYSYTDTCFGIANNFTDNSTVSSGTITNWDWDFGDTQSSNIEDPTHNYLIEGIYVVQLIVTTNNSCSDTIVKNNIEVWPLPNVNFITIPVCLNNVTQFTDTSTVSNVYTINTNETWTWDFGDGIGVSNVQHPNYMYASDGDFMATLTVTTNRNCVNAITKPVTIYPLPEVDFVADNPSDCSPVEGILTNLTTISGISTITQWDWDFNGDEVQDASNIEPTYSLTNLSHTSYKDFSIRLIATSNFGCKDTLVKENYIQSMPIPLASFSYWPNEVTIVDKELTFTDLSIIADSWTWDLGDGTTSDLQHPIHEYADTGFYLVALKIENQYGCLDSTQKYIQIKPIYAVWIPNAFTPNNDFINDYFSVDGYGISQLHIAIYNKWGELLFESDGLESKWDGTFKGNLVQEDVYVYKIRVFDVLFEWHDYIGKIFLLK